MFKRPESVLVLVYTVDTQVLLLQRCDDERFWQSVTGSLEASETPAEAAQRELFEETGLSELVVDHKQSTTFEIKGPWRARYAPDVTHNKEHRFSVQLPCVQAITLHPEEHRHFLWLPAADAISKASSLTNRSAIEEVVLNGVAS